MTEGFTQREIPCHCHAKVIIVIPQKLSRNNYAGLSLSLNNILGLFPRQPKSSGSKPPGGKDLLPKAHSSLTLGALACDPRSPVPRYDFPHRSVVARLLPSCSLSDSSQEVPAADEAFRRYGEVGMCAEAAWTAGQDFAT